jgi:hypothetical protein
MIPIFPVGSFPTLSLVEFLSSPPRNQLDGFGCDVPVTIISDKEVNGGHGVIENAKAEELLGLKKPLEPPTAVPGKLEKELLLMASMGNVPHIAGYVMPVCSRHEVSSLK